MGKVVINDNRIKWGTTNWPHSAGNLDCVVLEQLPLTINADEIESIWIQLEDSARTKKAWYDTYCFKIETANNGKSKTLYIQQTTGKGTLLVTGVKILYRG